MKTYFYILTIASMSHASTEPPTFQETVHGVKFVDGRTKEGIFEELMELAVKAWKHRFRVPAYSGDFTVVFYSLQEN